MRVKLYRAPGMSAAMALIRAELGPEAMILATRRVAEGIEVTAALEDTPGSADAEGDFQPDDADAFGAAPSTPAVQSYPEVLDDADMAAHRRTRSRGPADAEDWAPSAARMPELRDGFGQDRRSAVSARLAVGAHDAVAGLDGRVGAGVPPGIRARDAAAFGEMPDAPADWPERQAVPTRQMVERSPDRSAVLRAVAAASSSAVQSRPSGRSNNLHTGAEGRSRAEVWTPPGPRVQPVPLPETAMQGAARAGYDAAHRSAALAWHGVPTAISTRLSAGPLAFALSIALPFASLDLEPGAAPLLLAGPPGAGKTLTTARLATRLVLAGCKPLVITADGRRAGATEQLAAFTRLLGLHLLVASTPAALQRALARRQHEEPVLIDGPGIDPFIPAQLEELASLAASVAAVTALVCPAGLDPNEAADLASVHRARGATLMIANRLDTGRRLGGVLAAANAGLALTQAGIGPGAADGLIPLTPEILATRLITLPDRSS